MRDGLLTTKISLASALAFWLAASAALAQEQVPAPAPAPTPEVAPAADECFPKCRSGFFCQQGECRSLCNPPCADDEKCTPDGECVLKAPPLPPPPDEPREPKYVPHHRVALGLTAGAMLCAGEGGCDTAKKDAGVYASLRGGTVVLPWLVADLDAAFAPLFLKETRGIDSTFLVAAGLGARFLPLARRGAVDPVLGLHLGYALQHVAAISEEIDRWSNNALYLEYSVGLSFNPTPVFSLAVTLDVFEPFWLSTCTTTKASTGNPVIGLEAQDATTTCAKFEGAHDQFFFGAGIAGSFWL